VNESSGSATAADDSGRPDSAWSDHGLWVVHEDDELLVVDKPAGLVVHPSKHGPHSSVIGRVRLYLGHQAGRLVNRLDRETSGLVLVAKSASVARDLGRLFAAGSVEKRYLAVVHGRLTGACVIDAPIGPDSDSPVAIRDRVRADGATASTEVAGLRVFDHDGRAFSLIDVRPRTGRKHQIRIHLAHAGHPIVGDKIYGPDETIYLRFVEDRMTTEDRRRLILPHQALSAVGLTFTWAGRGWRFETKPGPELGAFAGLDGT